MAFRVPDAAFTFTQLGIPYQPYAEPTEEQKMTARKQLIALKRQLERRFSADLTAATVKIHEEYKHALAELETKYTATMARLGAPQDPRTKYTQDQIDAMTDEDLEELNQQCMLWHNRYAYGSCFIGVTRSDY